jgi:SAM-dependent methyltransferase
VDPAKYDAWYRTPRGAWIGEIEYRLLWRALSPSPGESLIDVGCGTGYFTRRFANDGVAVTGVDVDQAALDFAQAHGVKAERYLHGDARKLPFPDRSFDVCVSVTALCFIPEEDRALREMLRVSRRRIAIGLLNRRSMLYLQKGRHGGQGAYRGAHWHTAAEVRALFTGMPARDLALSTGVFLPGAGKFSRAAEGPLSRGLLLGAFLVVSAAPTEP